MVPNSFSQNRIKEILFFKTTSCVDKILLIILYWNSLNLVSNVLTGSKFIFSQSNWDVRVLKASLYSFLRS